MGWSALCTGTLHLRLVALLALARRRGPVDANPPPAQLSVPLAPLTHPGHVRVGAKRAPADLALRQEIGRASCRERCRPRSAREEHKKQDSRGREDREECR